ncbi:hypothetical protein [Spiroplasma endosymbiont of Polydrusus formosus]
MEEQTTQEAEEKRRDCIKAQINEMQTDDENNNDYKMLINQEL